ncbi:hypothetical protein Tco_1225724, partial [Tanacetum coccineum]
MGRGGSLWCESGDDGEMMMKMVDQWWCWLSGDDGAMMVKMVDRWWCWLSGDDGAMMVKMVDRVVEMMM